MCFDFQYVMNQIVLIIIYMSGGGVFRFVPYIGIYFFNVEDARSALILLLLFCPAFCSHSILICDLQNGLRSFLPHCPVLAFCHIIENNVTVTET